MTPVEGDKVCWDASAQPMLDPRSLDMPGLGCVLTSHLFAILAARQADVSDSLAIQQLTNLLQKPQLNSPDGTLATWLTMTSFTLVRRGPFTGGWDTAFCAIALQHAFSP